MTPEEAKDQIRGFLWEVQGRTEVPQHLVDHLLAMREALLVALGGRPVARGSSFSDTWHGCHDEDREAWVVPDE